MDREHSAKNDAPEGSWGPVRDRLRPLAPRIAGTVLALGEAPPDLLAAVAPLSVRASATGAEVTDGTRFDAVVVWAGADPLAACLSRALAHLREGGCLVLALDNALALPRLAAGAVAPEPPGSQTRAGLRALLAAAGLPHQDWWFPFPDRHGPVSFLSERGLCGAGGFDPAMLAAGAAGPGPHGGAWRQVAQAGLLGDLAPAFLVAASAVPLPPDPRVALHLGLRRRPEFERLVSFARTDVGVRVTRAPLSPGLPARLHGVCNLFPSEAFVPGLTWQAALDDLLDREGWRLAAVADWAARWWRAVAEVFAGGGALGPDTPLPAEALDAIPRNLIFAGEPRFIDLEWALDDPLDAGHLALRGLVNALGGAQAPGLPETPLPSLLDALRAVLPALGMAMDDAALAERLARESRFQSVVSGQAIDRDLAWLAATPLRLRAAPSPGSARLEAENAALRVALATERAAREEAEAEGARRTDRVVAYAAELDRDRDRLEAALCAARAQLEAQTRAAAAAAAPERPRRPARRALPSWLGGRA